MICCGLIIFENNSNTHAQSGKTALVVAAQRGHFDCVRLLLDAGADANVKNKVRVLFCIVAVRVLCLYAICIPVF